MSISSHLCACLFIMGAVIFMCPFECFQVSFSSSCRTCLLIPFSMAFTHALQDSHASRFCRHFRCSCIPWTSLVMDILQNI